jgi:voltage-gated potassium channel Kch
MKVDKQLYLLALGSILALILGTLGFHQYSPENGWWTAFYQAIQLFSMESGVLDEPPTPLLVEFARWIALGTLIALVYATVQALLGHFFSTLRIAFAKNHAIICGAGQRGDVLARAFCKKGSGRVVVIELDENNPSLGELRNIGVEVIIGNALDATVLQKAGIAKARSLVAVTGNDEKNLSICTEVETNLNPRCELSAGIESWGWRSYYLDRLRSKTRLDSYLSRATRRLMLQIACEAIQEPDFREKGVRVLIDASEATRQELIRAAAIMLQISGDRKPVLEVTSVRKGEKEAFLDRFPATHLVADIRWHEDTAGLAFPEGSGDSPDFAIFAHSTDIESLEAAERFWMRHETPDAHVFACLNGDSDTSSMTTLQKKKRDFSIVNLLSLGLGSKDPLEPDIEHRAKICHAIYYKNEKAKNPAYGSDPTQHPEDWTKLSERTRESNRLAAMHHEVKIHGWAARAETPDLEMLTHLSRCEHMRWMAEKVMDGWRWSQSHDKNSRENDKLKHHLLTVYDSLSCSEKDKDYNAFLWALNLPDSLLSQLELDDDCKRLVQFGRELS